MNPDTLQLFADSYNATLAIRNTDWLFKLLIAAKNVNAFAAFSDRKCRTALIFHTGSLPFNRLIESNQNGTIDINYLSLFTNPFKLAEMTPNVVNRDQIPENHLLATRFSPYDTSNSSFTFDYKFLPHPYYAWMQGEGDKSIYLDKFRCEAATWVSDVCKQLGDPQAIFDYRHGKDALFTR